MARMTMPARTSLHGLLVVCTALLLAACEEQASAPPPIRLGVIVDVSGPSASLGLAGRNGMQLAVEEANAAGGIQGRPVELLYRDDGFDPQRARQAAAELIAIPVEAALGPMTSLIAEQLAPQFTEAGILLMGGTPLSPLLAGRDDQFFRTLSHTNPDAPRYPQPPGPVPRPTAGQCDHRAEQQQLPPPLARRLQPLPAGHRSRGRPDRGIQPRSADRLRRPGAPRPGRQPRRRGADQQRPGHRPAGHSAAPAR